MRSVLGIDAAWTLTQPSGVALAVEDAGGWRLAAVAASYEDFVAAVDMPLVLLPIPRRRAACDAVSRAYGSRACGTHIMLGFNLG